MPVAGSTISPEQIDAVMNSVYPSLIIDSGLDEVAWYDDDGILQVNGATKQLDDPVIFQIFFDVNDSPLPVVISLMASLRTHQKSLRHVINRQPTRTGLLVNLWDSPWPKPVRDSLMSKLCNIVRQHDLGALGACVSVPGYRSVFPESGVHDQYLLCLGLCFAKDVVRWFGSWPDFHDAEVVSITLNRSEGATVEIHTFEMTSEVDVRGFYVLAKHA